MKISEKHFDLVCAKRMINKNDVVDRIYSTRYKNGTNIEKENKKNIKDTLNRSLSNGRISEHNMLELCEILNVAPSYLEN